MSQINLIRNMLCYFCAGIVMSIIVAAAFCQPQRVATSPMFGTGLGKQNFLVPCAHTLVVRDANAH